MSLADYLRENRYTAATAHGEYLLERNNNNLIHVFIEGKDDPVFYTKFISSSILTKSHRFYLCGNKEGVIEVEKKVSSDKQSIPLLFFADKDLDNYFNITLSPDIHVTEYYSHESYFAHLLDYKFPLCSINGLPHGLSTETAQITKAINDNLKLFYSDMKIVMATIMELKNIHGAKSIKLSGVNISKYFIINGSSIKVDKKAVIGKILSDNKAARPSNIGILIQYDKFKCDNPLSWIRGKWVLSFLSKNIEILPPIVVNKLSIMGYSNKINNSNLVSLCVSSINVPTITQYLQKLGIP